MYILFFCTVKHLDTVIRFILETTTINHYFSLNEPNSVQMQIAEWTLSMTYMQHTTRHSHNVIVVNTIHSSINI